MGVALFQKKELKTLAEEVSLLLGLIDPLTVEVLANLEKDDYRNAPVTVIMAIADILKVEWTRGFPIKQEEQISFFNFLNSSGFNNQLLQRVFPIAIIEAKERLQKSGEALSVALMRNAWYYVHRVFSLESNQLATYNKTPDTPLRLPALSPVRCRQRPDPEDLAGNVCANLFVTLADTIAKAVPVNETSQIRP